MKYVSTRGQTDPHSLSTAILAGLASDGGLFFPEEIPTITKKERQDFESESFSNMAAKLFRKFGEDFSSSELTFAAESAYSDFDSENVAPVRQLDKDLFLLELFHGPTGAFKDFALQFLPRLTALAVEKENSQDRCVLVATSGDTGGAALAGFADVPCTTAIIFFPDGGVSYLQKSQMQSAPGKNVRSVEISGDFDEAQSGVKEIFSDPEFAKQVEEEFGIKLSSANSINIGRLLPQIFYAFSAHAQLVKSGHIEIDEEIDVCVPTGNFGDIFSTYIAKLMGLPIGKLICASNANDTSAQFLQTGVFDIRGRKTEKTLSPAMDILRASNLERMLYYNSGRNPESIRKWQKQLIENGVFEVDPQTFENIKKDFEGITISDEETKQEINQSFSEYDFLPDPHTAVALRAVRKMREKSGERRKTIVYSTAHFGKFGRTVFESLFPEDAVPEKEIDILEKLHAVTRSPDIPERFFGVLTAKKIYTGTSGATTEDMKKEIIDFLRSQKT